eukprot:3456908-Amphidinium_carterae.2
MCCDRESTRYTSTPPKALMAPPSSLHAVFYRTCGIAALTGLESSVQRAPALPEVKAHALQMAIVLATDLL